jgi:hypothetical protein
MCVETFLTSDEDLILDIVPHPTTACPYKTRINMGIHETWLSNARRIATFYMRTTPQSGW